MKAWLLMTTVILVTTLGASVHAVESAATGGWGAYWAKFQSAVAADDKEKVAALTQFPFTYNDPIDKVAFLKVYPKIFNAKNKGCLAKEKPVKDENGGYSAFCGELLFYFTAKGGDFKFSDLGAND